MKCHLAHLPARCADGIQISEAITGDGATIFRHACWMDLEGIISKRIGSRREWPNAGMAEDQEP
jgi:ATP-dependent DNA ligase